ncbi:MAG TPA: ABC transporter permease [Flavitalea sp.]|nr:ABC transporter permease [Flavitalea sp.]
MFRNYLTIALRNIRNNKLFSFINIFGLATGFACCLLIALYIQHELSYDKHHVNIDRLYQVNTVFVNENGDEHSTGTPSPLAPALKQEFPEVKEFSRLMNLFLDDKTLMRTNSDSHPKAFYETHGYLADSTFFQLFSYPFVEGNPSSSLMEPNSIVLNEEIARKLFGNEHALNKMVHIGSNTAGDIDFRVTGVFRESGLPSHIDARFFLSLNSGGWGEYVRRTTDMASNNMFFSYLLLKPGADAQGLSKKLPRFVEKYMRKDLKAAGFSKKQFIQPVRDLHLETKARANVTPNGSKVYLYILSSIALFTLLIACINFMNLATSRSAKRAAEVGVRKVLGAGKKSLMKQFLGEAVIHAVIALIFSLILVELLLPFFSRISGKSLRLDFEVHFPLICAFTLLAILAGLLSGSYPAFYLSSFQPIKVLKGRFSNSLAAVSLRKVLVVFQFTISITLIIASVVISRQMNYLQTKDLGFEQNQQLVIPLRSSNARAIFPALKNELKRNRMVSSAAGSQYYPGIFNPSDMNFYREGKTADDAINVKMNYVDVDFLSTLKIQPVAGRLFSEKFPADTNRRMIVNEETASKLGMKPGEIIGKPLLFDWRGETMRFEVVGVVKNFHFESLEQKITPFAFQLQSSTDYAYLIVHSNTAQVKPLIAGIEKQWSLLNPNEPFEYSFIDQDFQKNYEAQQRLSGLVGYFTIIGIVICCLGLFGLASFSAEQRTKEIGIRKVLGSSVSGIVTLLSKDFMKLVLLGNLVALPIAWFVMKTWLQEFAYRAPLNWWLFVVAAAAAFSIAFITVSFQAIKTAMSNPVKSLRSE